MKDRAGRLWAWTSARQELGRTNHLSYVETEAWLGREFEHLDPDDAVVDLARRYLAGYGPAREADLAWWAGTTKTRVAEALERLDLVEFDEGLLLLADDAEAFSAVAPPPPDRIDVLPVWDCYTMGYPRGGRFRLADADHVDRLYDEVGNGLGAVLRGAAPSPPGDRASTSSGSTRRSTSSSSRLPMPPTCSIGDSTRSPPSSISTVPPSSPSTGRFDLSAAT